MRTISIAKDFSRHPAGRFERDGPSSGELFRRKFLIPSLREEQDKIVIEMDGARGYGSSFLEEAFGGLVREGFDKERLLRTLVIIASNASLKVEIEDYIKSAAPTQH
ncbi:STAS-like domain-containing protein [Cupriavidus sp. amp6]|uniref:STAS-like domain-containing protein n=1 Tax=Cupriavidus sp. amp6 TaxID=388051 RepID=UPI000491C407|nr:STAS-like domain-containing protein [Cupriavidus sp. amp6]